MKAAHDYLWPDPLVWNFWTERRFRHHCKDWQFISMAGGSHIAKSYDAAKIALLYWLADPEHRGIIVASTTLAGMERRIWGYILKFLKSAAIQLPYHYKQTPNPKITYRKDELKKAGEARDTLHGMMAIAAKRGDSSEAIANWIGTHPDNGMLVVLDECTNMPTAILDAIPNLDTAKGGFQLIGIANSDSKYDLHGMLSTPKVGWNNIDPYRDHTWETTQHKGVCLFFSCYESPAIMEQDPVKKAALSKVFITQEKLERKEQNPGKDSEGFWRFTLGFWKSSAVDNTVISEPFLKDYKIGKDTEWSGLYPLKICAGLDPAFSTGGDNCVLRLAYLGVDIMGNVVLDFKRETLLFKIPIAPNSGSSAESQIATKVLSILNQHGATLANLCIDASGAGRGLAEILKLTANSLFTPKKIFTIRHGRQRTEEEGVFVKTNYELWFGFRDFIQKAQIRGLDDITLMQLTTRLVEIDPNSKRQTLENKLEYRQRMKGVQPELAHSPDEADAAALCLQSAILNFGFYPGETKNMNVLVANDPYLQSAIRAQREVDMKKKEYDRKTPIKSGFGGGFESYLKMKRI